MVSDMAHAVVLSLACAFFLVASSAHAAVVEHTFNVGNLTVNKLCQDRVITAVNKKLPGPTIHVNEGDTVIVHVNNNSPYNITIHWHGIFQLLTPWADGPNYITQCPIVPGNSYTYKFNITGQEGTLWWHAHASTLRATVYGVLIIRPRARGRSNPYPFPKPHKEVPIIFGEWWDANVVDVENDAIQSGGAPSNSDAYTINGNPGDLYKCSANQTYKLEVVQGERYMLRIINAALNNQLFFKIANHSFTVVAADASYTMPYDTDVIVIAPGQTVDALMVANASSAARYYMAARPYSTAVNVPFDSTTTTGIVEYKNSSVGNQTAAIMPTLPDFLDTPTAHRFYTNLTALIKPGSRPKVPLVVNESMFVTFGLGLTTCGANQTKCQGLAVAASMNNVSFAFPTRMSLLEAQYKGAQGIYTSDFPNEPPIVFDYTNTSVNTDPALASLSFTPKGTRVKKVKYGAVVEMVLQNTALLATENHPMHLHSFNFFVLAQGFGNYNASADVKSYNLVNPQERNTIAVPTGGWAVIRFKADNPGMWFMHCHLDVHLTWGLAMAFEVENGPDAASILPPPPPDFPTC